MTSAQIKKIIEGLDFTKKGSVVLILSSPDNFDLLKDSFIKYLNENHNSGIYVTLEKPYDLLFRELQKAGVNITKLHVIDVSGKKKKSNNANATVIKHPKSIVELSLVITEVNNTGKYKFIFFDSMSRLLHDNKLKTVEKFLSYLINKIIIHSNLGVFMSLNKDKARDIAPMLHEMHPGKLELIVI